MATVINNPTGSAEDAGSNLVVGVVLAIIILGAAVLFFVYGLPAMQNNQNPNGTNINVTVPENTTTPNTNYTPAQ